jgi:thymidine kinase
MSKLYFKYGVMGSSKSAQALITKFNYEERGMKVVLYKPSTDTRSREVSSRIGLKSECIPVEKDDILNSILADVIIIDECQFLTTKQVDELREVVDKYNIPVICYGLRTDFQSHLFEGSKRLLEIADSIEEIKAMCKCGRKAIMSARIVDGKVTKNGEQIDIGGNEKYVPMCHKCWNK